MSTKASIMARKIVLQDESFLKLFEDRKIMTSYKIPELILEVFVELKRRLDLAHELIPNESLTNDSRSYHSSLGRVIRNEWLWNEESKHRKLFKDLKIWHPDDMSSILLDAWQVWLNDKDLDFVKFVVAKKVSFDKFWKSYNVDPDTGRVLGHD